MANVERINPLDDRVFGGNSVVLQPVDAMELHLQQWVRLQRFGLGQMNGLFLARKAVNLRLN